MTGKIYNQYRILVISILILLSCSVRGQSDRETWQPPRQIMDSVGVRPGMVIGEVGAGRGHFTFHLAERVHQNGKVYANDISKSALETLSSRAEAKKADNITIVLGNSEDPLFPEKDLDMVIMVYVLHHMETPVEMLNSIKKYMKPTAKMVIIEKDTEKDRDAYPHFMSKKQVLETVDQSDYELEQIQTFLQRDIIYIYRIKD